MSNANEVLDPYVFIPQPLVYPELPTGYWTI